MGKESSRRAEGVSFCCRGEKKNEKEVCSSPKKTGGKKTPTKKSEGKKAKRSKIRKGRKKEKDTVLI